MQTLHSPRLLARGLFLTALLPLLGATTYAGTLYISRLSGANESPPTTSTDTGIGVLILNDAENQGTITATHTITVPVTGGHIHRGAAGVNGPIIFPFPAPTSPVGPLTWSAIPAADVDNLKNGGLYMNFHTAASPGGAIRGQLVRARLAPTAATKAQTALANVLDVSAGYSSDLDQVLIQTNLANATIQAQTLNELTPGTLYVAGRQQIEAMTTLTHGIFDYTAAVRADPASASSQMNGFIRAGDGFGTRSASDNQTGSSISRPYVAAGLDRQLGGGSRGGLALSYSSARDNFRNGAGKTTAKTIAAQAFFSLPLPSAGFALDGAAGYGWSTIKTTRTLASLGRTASASPDGRVWAGALKASKTIALANQSTLIPYASIDVQKASTDSYTETGASSVGLVAAGRATWSSAVEAGTALLVPIKTQTGKLALRLAAGWHHLLEDGSGSATLFLAGSPLGFASRVDGPGKNAAHVEAALNGTLANGVLLSFGYKGLLGASHQTEHAIEASLTFKL